jgi:hypothetical protein
VLDGAIEGIPEVENINLKATTLESVFLKLREEEKLLEEIEVATQSQSFNLNLVDHNL